jgi:hypothetical protein
MKKLTATLIIACGLVAGSLHQADAAAVMRLSADGGVTWTNVVDNGPLDKDLTPGFITYSGPVGNWVVVIASGLAAPPSNTPLTPAMDLSTLDFSLDPETLIVQMSDTDFIPFPNETFVASLTTTTDGTLTYNTYRDTGNVLFGTTANSPTAAQLTTEGPFTGGTFTSSKSVVIANGGTAPYSLTLETTIVHTGGGQTTSDAFLFALPAPDTTPCVSLTKTAASDTAMAGGTMTYTYAITNCGGTILTNLAIIDDAGTPDFAGDDFSVVQNLTLAPGQGMSYQATVTLPMVECVSNSNPSLPAGTLFVQTLPSGDIEVTYRQARSLNDNVYGSPAHDDGWSGGHKFGDLTGSDKCEFRFTDSNGKVVLDFFSDYISQATSSLTPTGAVTYPSGYGSLGPNGGDGSLVTGAKSNVLFWTSTLADNLNSGLNSSNGIAFPSPFLINSPTPESANPNWDYVDGYTVIVSKNAFPNGFGGVTVPFQHNSPAKTGANQVPPVPCGGCITNLATVVIATNGVIVPGTPLASDDAVVCIGNSTPPPPSCIITPGAFKTGANTISIPLKNAGTASVVLSEVDLSWNQTANGRITKMSLNGDFWVAPPAPPGSPPGTNPNGLSSPIMQTSGFVADPTKRTIAKGQTKTLTITFEKPASKTGYTGTVDFGADCSVTFP